MSRILAALSVFLLTSCAIHQFAQPSHSWTTRSGQLAYHGNRRALIGEVLVRFSDRGDFELTFSKGPGVSLLTVRTDATFARVQGPLIGLPWSGPIAQPPARARGWLQVREQILHNPQNRIIRFAEGGEKFVLRF